MFNRELIGWNVSDRMTVDITVSAMDMAIGRRSQYAANACRKLLEDNGILQSMSRKGNN